MSHNELVDLTLHQHHETHAGDPERGAYLVSDDGDGTKAVWLPKIQCERGPARGRSIYEFAVAEWIAQEKGLI